MSSDPFFWAMAALAVTLLGLSKGGFAGVGQIAMPLMALFMPTLEAAALLLPVMIIQDTMALWVYRRTWDPWNLKIMLPGAAVGMVLAAILAAYLSDAFIRLAVGSISAVFVTYTWLSRSPRERFRPTVSGGLFWGAASAFTSTIAQAGGPPFQLFVLPQKLPKLVYVGTVAIFFAVVNAAKVIPFFLLGKFSVEHFRMTLMLVPLAIATNFLGVWLVRVTPTIVFYRVAHVLVFLLSLELIREGALGLMRG